MRFDETLGELFDTAIPVLADNLLESLKCFVMNKNEFFILQHLFQGTLLKVI